MIVLAGELAGAFLAGVLVATAAAAFSIRWAARHPDRILKRALEAQAKAAGAARHRPRRVAALSSTARCAACGASVTIASTAAWPERCPVCGAAPFATAGPFGLAPGRFGP